MYKIRSMYSSGANPESSHTKTLHWNMYTSHMSQRLRNPTLRRRQLKHVTSPSDVILTNRLHWNFENLNSSRLLMCHRRSKQFSLLNYEYLNILKMTPHGIIGDVVRSVLSADGPII
jgi:hypothetical protein